MKILTIDKKEEEKFLRKKTTEFDFSKFSKKEINELLKEMRKETKIPIVFFSYYNPILNYGLKNFAEDVSEAGVDGILILDILLLF